MQIRQLQVSTEHELVVESVEAAAGYHGTIAPHSTKVGPAMGGTRQWAYPSFDDAVRDALRLSRG